MTPFPDPADHPIVHARCSGHHACGANPGTPAKRPGVKGARDQGAFPPDSLPLGSPERRAWWIEYLAHVQARRAAAHRADGALCIVLGVALLVSAALLVMVWP